MVLASQWSSLASLVWMGQPCIKLNIFKSSTDFFIVCFGGERRYHAWFSLALLCLNVAIAVL